MRPPRIAEHAARARESFNRRFWYEEGGYLYDVVDAEQGGNDSPCAQTSFSPSHSHPVLDETQVEARPRCRHCETADTRRSSIASPGTSGLQIPLLRRSSVTRCRVSSGYRLVVADRTVHRLLA